MKSLRTFLVLSFCLIPVLAETQTPPPPPPPPPPVSGKTNKADSLLNEGNIKAAVTEYNKLYHANPAERMIIYNYACALSLDKQVDSALKYLDLAEKTDPAVWALIDPALSTLREDKKWNDFESNLITLLNRKSENPIKDIDYARRLWRILSQDQSYFYETIIAVKKLGPDSPVVSAVRKLQTLLNEKNLRELDSLLPVKGWPKRSQVGIEASRAPFFVIQHSNATAQQKYLPLLEKCCRENEADWKDYALMFDRMRMNRSLPQRYGTHYNLDNRKSGEKVLYPLEDETKVNEWRKEIGLEPLKDYLSGMNIKK